MTTTTITEKNHPERITRTIQTADGWTIKQVTQGRVEGTTDEFYWWNIDMYRTPHVEELGHKGRSWTGR